MPCLNIVLNLYIFGAPPQLPESHLPEPTYPNSHWPKFPLGRFPFAQIYLRESHFSESTSPIPNCPNTLARVPICPK